MRNILRQIDDRLHQERLRKIRTDAADRRRRKEQLTIQIQESEWRLRRAMQRSGQPLAPSLLLDRLDYVIERDGVILDEAKVTRYRADADKWARVYKTAVHEVATGGTNAYAFTKVNRIEVAPIVSPQTYSVRMHEQGHVAMPCTTTHTRVTLGALDSLCVDCEIAAWEWAIEHACEWTREMHRRLSRSLATYRPHAKGEQVRRLDHLCSDTAYAEARLQRLTKGL